MCTNNLKQSILDKKNEITKIVKKESLNFLEMYSFEQSLDITIISHFYITINRCLRFHSKEVHVWVCTWHPDVFVKSKSILLYWGWSFNYIRTKSDNILPYNQDSRSHISSGADWDLWIFKKTMSHEKPSSV